MIDAIKKSYEAYRLMTIVKKTSHTRFITAYTKQGKINGILINKGILRSTIRRPKLGDHTLWNTEIDFVRHQKVNSLHYM
jgi:Mg2+/Co2+ transporter CorC